METARKEAVARGEVPDFREGEELCVLETFQRQEGITKECGRIVIQAKRAVDVVFL